MTVMAVQRTISYFYHGMPPTYLRGTYGSLGKVDAPSSF